VRTRPTSDFAVGISPGAATDERAARLGGSLTARLSLSKSRLRASGSPEGPQVRCTALPPRVERSARTALDFLHARITNSVGQSLD
jgi:hypothetical protein